jgi:hypothetical protein
MREMIELVARAIYEASNHNKPYSLLTAFQREKCEREASAAIGAMLEWEKDAGESVNDAWARGEHIPGVTQ